MIDRYHSSYCGFDYRDKVGDKVGDKDFQRSLIIVLYGEKFAEGGNEATADWTGRQKEAKVVTRVVVKKKEILPLFHAASDVLLVWNRLGKETPAHRVK